VLELEAEVAELRRQVAALQSGQRQRQSTSEA
jgi:polyhydroxyalkanoate synthesis regulator phasin